MSPFKGLILYRLTPPYWQGEVVRVWKNRLLGLGLNELRGELGLLR